MEFVINKTTKKQHNKKTHQLTKQQQSPQQLNIYTSWLLGNILTGRLQSTIANLYMFMIVTFCKTAEPLRRLSVEFCSDPRIVVPFAVEANSCIAATTKSHATPTVFHN